MIMAAMTPKGAAALSMALARRNAGRQQAQPQVAARPQPGQAMGPAASARR